MRRWPRLLILLILSSLSLFAQSRERVFQVGVPLVYDLEQTHQQWHPLVEYLNQQLGPPFRFQLQILDLDALEDAVAASELDFLFVNPSLYVHYSYRYGLSSPLATLLNQEQDHALSQFAGVVFTRPERTEIRQLQDLKGLTVATPSQQSLAAYQMQAVELKHQGLDPGTDIILLETGLPLTNVMDAVTSGLADVGFMRAGVLEKLQQKGHLTPASFRIVEPRQVAGFPWITSTRLYPEWPFAALAHTDTEVVRQVTAALLNLPVNSSVAQQIGIAGFTIPGDYRGIDRLLQDLHLPPFDQSPPISLQQIWLQWQLYWLLLILCAAALLAFAVIILKRKNRHLAITQQTNQQITAQLRENEALLNHAQQVARIGSWDYDLQTELFNCTDQMRLMFGLTADQPIRIDDFIARIAEEDRAYALKAWDTALKKGRDYEMDYRVQVGHELRWFHERLHVIRNTRGDMVRLLGTVQDVTDKVEYEQHIESLAFNDALTKIPNRAWLHEALDKLLRQRNVRPHSAVLVLLNIDRFKTINNARGSRFGDGLLCAIGERLQGCELLDVSVKVARIAGDEFAVLLQSDRLVELSVNRLEALLAEHCQALFAQPFMVDEEPVSVTASAGVTRFPELDDPLSAEQVFQRASMALTHSRLEGGGQLSFYESPMSEAAGYRFRLERDLSRAVQQNQLRLFMQPQFDVQGRKRAAELLLRWEHPELGMISPADFIPIAESSNLIVDLDVWVLEQACQLMHQAAAQGIELCLAVNISPRHFCKQSFVPWMQSVLEQQQINPRQLMLEVTEGLFLNNIEDVCAKMQALRRLGVSFSIDDFGTGYSSLAYLKRLPVNEIKIDRSFVQDAPRDTEDAALIEAILAVADKMQLQVVAEGVETLEQAEFLKARSQSILFQGYFYGRPAPVQEWLMRWQNSEQAESV